MALHKERKAAASAVADSVANELEQSMHNGVNMEAALADAAAKVAATATLGVVAATAEPAAPLEPLEDPRNPRMTASVSMITGAHMVGWRRLNPD